MLAETLCAAVSAAGLGIAALTAYRKRFLAAARITAYALVPVGLVMTGVVEWVSGMAFKPTVWIGFGLLALAWLLFVTTRAVERRSLGAAGKPAKKVKGGTAPEAVAPAASAPSLGAAGAQPRPSARRKPPVSYTEAAGRRSRGRLLRHRGHPQEARHLTPGPRPVRGLGHEIGRTTARMLAC